MVVDFAALRDCDPSSIGNAVSAFGSVAGKISTAHTTASGVGDKMRDGAWRGQAADNAVAATGRYETHLDDANTEADVIKEILTDAQELFADAKDKLDEALDAVDNNPYLKVSDNGKVSTDPPASSTSIAMLEELTATAEELNVKIEQAVAEAQLVDIETAAALRGASGSESERVTFNGDANDHAVDRENIDTIIHNTYKVDDKPDSEIWGQSVTGSEREIYDSFSWANRRGADFSTGHAVANAEGSGWAYGTGDHNNAYDARRHASWNAYLTQSIGVDNAERFTTAHEWTQPSPQGGDGSPPVETVMDLHNNEVGRQIATENPGATEAEIDRLVHEAIENGELLVIDDNGNLTPSDGYP